MYICLHIYVYVYVYICSHSYIYTSIYPHQDVTASSSISGDLQYVQIDDCRLEEMEEDPLCWRGGLQQSIPDI